MTKTSPCGLLIISNKILLTNIIGYQCSISHQNLKPYNAAPQSQVFSREFYRIYTHIGPASHPYVHDLNIETTHNLLIVKEGEKLFLNKIFVFHFFASHFHCFDLTICVRQFIYEKAKKHKKKTLSETFRMKVYIYSMPHNAIFGEIRVNCQTICKHVIQCFQTLIDGKRQHNARNKSRFWSFRMKGKILFNEKAIREFIQVDKLVCECVHLRKDRKSKHTNLRTIKQHVISKVIDRINKCCVRSSNIY